MDEDKDAPKWRQILTDGQGDPLPWKMAAVIVGGALVIAAIIWLGSFLNEALEAGLIDPDKKFEGLRNLGLFFAALIGLPFLLWRTVIASKQSATAAEQARLAEDRSFSDLFTKAVEQLGADKTVKRQAKDRDGNDAFDENGVPVMMETTEPNIEVRLGAIYALQRISRASEKDHIPVMETLCAYICENAVEGEPEEFEEPDWDEISSEEMDEVAEGWHERQRTLESPPLPLRADVNAALRVIAERDARLRASEKVEDFRLDFRRANFQRANLSGFDFERADLRAVRLEGADLEDAKMQDAMLHCAQMQKAVLWGAQMQRASLEAVELQGADLWGAKMQRVSLVDADMYGASLWQAEMSGANLTRATLRSGSLMEVYMDQCIVSGADFTDIIDLTQSDLDRFFGCRGTKLPAGLTHPDHWHPEGLQWDEVEPAYQNWLTTRKAANLPPFDKPT